MRPAVTVLSLLLVVSALLSCFISGWALTLRRSMPTMAFVALTAAMALYSGGYAIEINQDTVEGALLAVKFEYLGLAFIPVLLLVVAAQLILQQRLAWPLLAGLLVVPAITLLLVLTMPAHDLFYVNPVMDDTGAFPTLSFERGPWYLVNYTYQTVVVLVSAVLLIRYSLRVRSRSRLAALLVTAAAMLPLASSLIYFAGLVPNGIDPVPLMLGLTGVVLAAALFGLRLFDLIPAAREVALDSVSEALLVIDPLGLVRDFNRSATELPGLSGLASGAPIPGDSPVGQHLEELAADPGRTLEFPVWSDQGVRHLSATCYRVSDPRGTLSGTTLMVRDITTQRSLVDELARQATTDELTGALSRRAVLAGGESMIMQAREDHQPLAVIMVDLDEFKELNDALGHAAGDKALEMASGMMRSCIRSGDLFGRLGGDEFVIIMPSSDVPRAEDVALRLHQCLRNGGPSPAAQNLRASIGVAAGQPRPGDSLAEYLEAADQALYDAKRAGGDRTSVLHWPQAGAEGLVLTSRHVGGDRVTSWSDVADG